MASALTMAQRKKIIPVKCLNVSKIMLCERPPRKNPEPYVGSAESRSEFVFKIKQARMEEIRFLEI